jgi:Acyltransferase family
LALAKRQFRSPRLNFDNFALLIENFGRVFNKAFIFMAAVASLSLTPGELVHADRRPKYRKFSTNDYQPQFDGLRAIAVLAVMSDHFAADIPNFPLPDWIHLGTTGVRLFLVLSGYFITASLRRARTRIDRGEVVAAGALRSFYWRRTLRILRGSRACTR